jgi:hypothetical protein
MFFLDHNTFNGFGQFLILTIIMGGGAAFMAGRSLANGWRSIGLLLLYMIPFTAGVRFLHYALFQGTLSSLPLYIMHGIIVAAFALFGYRLRRAEQMSSQYPWLYERSGLLTWRNKN